MDGWGKVKKNAERVNLSERTFRGLLKQGLRYVRLPSGTILVKYEWVDEFLEKYEVKPDNTVNDLVDSVLKGLNNGD